MMVVLRRSVDPSRTTMLRRTFERRMRKRWKWLEGQVVELVADLDVFGLEEPKPMTFESLSSLTVNVDRQAWRFRTDEAKLSAFRDWFQSMMNDGIFSVTNTGQPWTNSFVESAYRKGQLRSYMEGKPWLRESLDFWKRDRARFLASAFGQPEKLSKLRLLGLRTFEELKGIGAVTAQHLSRVLAEGLAAGLNPLEIARWMRERINGIGRRRSELLSRTEIIHAHAEGQLDAFEDLGVEEVGVMAEWQTAKDTRVCLKCEPLHGVVMTIPEARGLIPRHPDCRCAFIPANVGESRRGQIWSKSGKRKAFRKSMGAERGRWWTVSEAVAGSSWFGKEKTLKTVRFW